MKKDEDGYIPVYPNEDTNVTAGRTRVIGSRLEMPNDAKGILIPVSSVGVVQRVKPGEPVTVTFVNTSNKHLPIRKDEPMAHIMLADPEQKVPPKKKTTVVRK